MAQRQREPRYSGSTRRVVGFNFNGQRLCCRGAWLRPGTTRRRPGRIGSSFRESVYRPQPNHFSATAITRQLDCFRVTENTIAARCMRSDRALLGRYRLRIRRRPQHQDSRFEKRCPRDRPHRKLLPVFARGAAIFGYRVILTGLAPTLRPSLQR